MEKTLLVTSYYDCGNAVRQVEINDCLMNNALAVDQVLLLLDHEMELPSFVSKMGMSSVVLNKRVTFKDAFNIASTINPEGINIVCNSDIYTTAQDVDLLDDIVWDDVVLAMSRWDDIKGKEPKLYRKKDSQDAWIFQGQMFLDERADFYFGTPGCDNRIASLLAEQKQVYNPSETIKFFHLHNTNIRTYSRQDKVEGDYEFIEPCSFRGKIDIKSVIHLALNGGGRQNALCNMLSSFGDYHELDWQKEIKANGIDAFRENLISLVESVSPDLLFMQLQTDNIIDVETAIELKKHAIYIVNWTGDVRDPLPRCYTDISHIVDTTLFTNNKDAKFVREYGSNAGFLQIGYDQEIYNPEMFEACTDMWDVIFMGNNYPGKFPLSDFRFRMVNSLSERYGNRFGLFGNNWGDIECSNLNNDATGEAYQYRNSKIAINCSHFEYDRYSSDRIFRILGCGTFCLTKYYPGIEKDFEIGVDLDVFHSISELESKIEYYLNNPAEINKIADNGYNKAVTKHTWDARKKELEYSLQFYYEHPKELPDFATLGNMGIYNEKHIKLSILVLTTYDRIDEYNSLVAEVFKQLNESGLEHNVQFLKKRDDGEMSIPEKRNMLLNNATGEYVCYIDDDDEIAPDYITSIFKAMKSNPDCVTFNGKVFVNGKNERNYNFSIDCFRYEYSDHDGYLRPPGHLTPIKREIAQQFKFNESMDRGSDVDWAMAIRDSRLVKTAEHINKDLYFYYRILNK